MRKILLLPALLWSATVFSQAQDSTAYKFILNYAVPSSPAFMALDASPQQVTRGSAAKPLVLHAFTNFLQTGRLDPGVAVDFSPYVLLGGGFKHLDEYQNNAAKRIVANSMLSLATLKNSKDSTNIDFGFGARITLIDDHDLFSNKQTARNITRALGTALAGRAAAPVVPGVPEDETGVNGEPAATVAVDLDRFYTEAYQAIRNKPGFALSAGYGYRTTARSSSLSKDSLVNNRSTIWLSGTRYTSGDFDVLGTIQGSWGDTTSSGWIAGIAVASKNKASNFGAELVYDFEGKTWNYGANFEIKILRQFSYVVSIGKRSVLVNGVELKDRLLIISNLRLNLFGR
jgi:hypothetical protein